MGERNEREWSKSYLLRRTQVDSCSLCRRQYEMIVTLCRRGAHSACTFSSSAVDPKRSASSGLKQAARSDSVQRPAACLNSLFTGMYTSYAAAHLFRDLSHQSHPYRSHCGSHSHLRSCSSAFGRLETSVLP